MHAATITHKAGRGERLAAVLAALALAALLITAACLSPSRSGVGTHTQLGLPPCGWIVLFQRPCPTCGMTTSFASAAHGRFYDALRAQPLGALLALAASALLWAMLHIALAGVRTGPMLLERINGRLLLTLGVLAAVAWGYVLAMHPPASAPPTACLPSEAGI